METALLLPTQSVLAGLWRTVSGGNHRHVFLFSTMYGSRQSESTMISRPVKGNSTEPGSLGIDLFVVECRLPKTTPHTCQIEIIKKFRAGHNEYTGLDGLRVV